MSLPTSEPPREAVKPELFNRFRQVLANKEAFV